MDFLTIKVYCFRTIKAVINKLFTVNNPGDIALHSLLDDKVNQECPNIIFNADDHIAKVLFPDPKDERKKPTDITELLDAPCP